MSQSETLQGLDTASQKHEKEIVIDLAPDRILHFLGVYVIILLAVVTKVTEYAGGKGRLSCFPIEQNKSDLTFIKHANAYCWESAEAITKQDNSSQNISTACQILLKNDTSNGNETNVDLDKYLPYPPTIRRFLQWMPYGMLLEAFLFALPMAYWHFMVGARLMGHLKFMQLLLQDIYESVKTIPAGIYRKEPYDEDGEMLNCWRKYKTTVKKQNPKNTANSDPPSQTRVEKAAAGGNVSDQGQQSGSVGNNTSDAEPLLPKESEHSKNGNTKQNQNKQEVSMRKNAEEAATGQSNYQTTSLTKNTQAGNLKTDNSPIPSGSSAKQYKKKSQKNKDAATTSHLSCKEKADPAHNVPVSSNNTPAPETKPPSQITSQQSGSAPKKLHPKKLREFSLGTNVSKHKQSASENTADRNDEELQKDSGTPTTLEQTTQQNSESGTDGGKLIEILKRAVTPDFVKEHEQTEKTRSRVDENEGNREGSTRLRDRHIFSMLCYENFASLQHQPYLKSVEKLVTVPKFEEIVDKLPEDEDAILPMRHAILRKFCNDKNFQSDFVVRVYFQQCAISIVLAVLFFAGITMSFVFVILPTFQSDAFLCDIPHHKDCLSCTLTGLVDVYAAFFANWLAVTTYLIVAAAQTKFVRNAHDHALSHFFEDVKPLCGVALVAAYKVATKDQKD